MRYTRRRRESDSGLFGSVGWLFADLMLALVVTAFLAAVIVPAPAEPLPPPPPTPSTTTTPTTTTTTPPRERLAKDPIKVDVFVDDRALLAGDAAAITGFQTAVQGALTGPMAGRRAGLVLTFGTGSTRDIQRVIQVANHFNDLVLRGLGDQFRDSALRAYFQSGQDTRKISLDVFVFEH